MTAALGCRPGASGGRRESIISRVILQRAVPSRAATQAAHQPRMAQQAKQRWSASDPGSSSDHLARSFNLSLPEGLVKG